MQRLSTAVFHDLAGARVLGDKTVVPRGRARESVLNPRRRVRDGSLVRVRVVLRKLLV